MAFQFKSKPVKPSSASSIPKPESLFTLNDISNNSNVKIFENLKNEKRLINEANGLILYLKDISNCTFVFQFSPNAVHIQNVTDSTFILLPIQTSILIQNCNKIKLVAAAQQIRIHDSVALTLHIHSATAVIIENSKEISVAPYRITELGISEFVSESFNCKKYSNSTDSWNNCIKIQDFDCVIGKSPNWTTLPESEWIEFSIKNIN